MGPGHAPAAGAARRAHRRGPGARVQPGRPPARLRRRRPPIAIWDVRRRTHRFTLSGHTGRIRGLAFAADGTLISGGDDGRIVRWSLDPAEAVRRVCANAGAGLSRDEWAAHLPSLDYQPRCDGSGGVR
ncbi:hypothetical protein ACFQX7_33910 [Luedemannella flava]